MSMNVHISGTRTVTFDTPRGKKTDSQSIKFDCWQTPTADTRKIISSPNPIEAYRQWVKANSRPHEEIEYNYHGRFTLDDGYPVLGTRIVDPGEMHLQEFDEWIRSAELDGYEIEVYEL